MEAAVGEFVAVTGSDEATARRYLAAAPNQSIEHAVSAFFNEQTEAIDVPVVVTARPPPPVPSRPHKPKSEPLPSVAAAAAPDDFVLMDK